MVSYNHAPPATHHPPPPAKGSLLSSAAFRAITTHSNSLIPQKIRDFTGKHRTDLSLRITTGQQARRGAVAKSTWAISALSKRWQVHAHTEEKLSFSTNFGRSPPTSWTKLTQNSFQIISATTVKPRPPPTQEKIFVQISHGCASTNIEIDFLSPHASSNKDVPMLL